MNNHNYCVIMAGGLGTRFWPISRSSRPKQFLNFTKTGKSFLRLAYERVGGIIPKENILVVSQERYRDLVLSEIPDIPADNLLLEPYNRNTASCIAYANYKILTRDPEGVVLVNPADQVVGEPEDYRHTICRGLEYAASNDVLLTLGVVPSRPDPNYGYIQTDAPLTDGSPVRVKTFTEKPSVELARVFLDSGEFLWNAGIFIWKASVIAEEMEEYVPEVTRQWNGWRDYLGTEGEKGFLERIYPDMPRTSIDYAVMEKSDRVMAIPAGFDWSDIGNWDSLYEYFSDGVNSVKVGGKSLLEDNSGTLVFSPSAVRLVAVKGLRDFVVVDIDNVLMICPRSEIKDFVTELSLPEYEKYK